MNEVRMNKRIWELDALRGFAFLLMVFDHLTYDLGFMFSFSNPILLKLAEFSQNYRFSNISEIIRFVFTSGVFIFISGICANFSRSNLKRGLRLFVIALLLTIGTVIFAEITKFSGFIIYFGILHLLSISMLLSPIFKRINKIILIILGITIIIVGIYLENHYYESSILLIPFNIKTNYFATADYYPLLPYMGIYIIGYVFGSIVYNKKQSLFKKDINIIPLNYLGRNALWLYFAHQVILVVLIFILNLLLK